MLERLTFTLPASVESNPARSYLAGLAPSGRRTMQSRLDAVARLLEAPSWEGVDWPTLTPAHVSAIRSILTERGLSPASVNATLAAVKGVCRAAWESGELDTDSYTRICGIKGVHGSRLPAGRELTNTEIASLMGTCTADPSPAGVRDAAILATLYTCGLRRSEVVNLDLDSYTEESGSLIVIGKGNKERTCWLVNGAAEAVGDWLTLRGRGPGPLFLAIDKGGHLHQGRLTDQAIYNMLVKRGQQAGLKHFSTHDFRRTFVGDLLDSGVDLATVQAMAGHSNPATTARYDRRPDQARKAAAERLHLHYEKRGE